MWLDLKLECRVGLSSASFLRERTVGFLPCQRMFRESSIYLNLKLNLTVES